MNLFIGVLLTAWVFFPFISNAINTINTVNALKFGCDHVKWIGLYGSILQPSKAGFNVDVYCKLENPTKSDITIDFIKLTLSISGNNFAIINYTDPLIIKAGQILIKPIQIKSATTSQLEQLVLNIFSSGKIPSTIHIVGTASANTWKASIDSDYNVIG